VKLKSDCYVRPYQMPDGTYSTNVEKFGEAWDAWRIRAEALLPDWKVSGMTRPHIDMVKYGKNGLDQVVVVEHITLSFSAIEDLEARVGK
jgi:hypothetical protein